jgi:hypothetical protein
MGISVSFTGDLEMGKRTKHSIPSVTKKAVPLLSSKQRVVKSLAGISTLLGRAPIAVLGQTRPFCLHFQAAVFRLPTRWS